MKKIICILLCVCVLMAFPTAVSASGTIYYIDSISGDDSANGTSASTAWKTVENLRGISFEPGTQILFKKGGIYNCTCLEITASGTKESPIVISSYGEGAKPVISPTGKNDVLHLFDCSYITVSGLEITAHEGGGIWIDTLRSESNGITLTDLTMHDMQNYKATSRDNLSTPANARACVMVKSLPSRSRYAVNNLTITDCEMFDVGNGISIWGSWNDEQNPWVKDEADIDPVFNQGVLVSGCYFHDMDAEAIIVGMCDGAVVTDCRCIDCCLNDGRNEDGTSFCNAAMWFWGSVNSTIRCCEIAGQKCLGDGMTCDFDSYTHHCTYEYIYSHDNVRFVNNCPMYSGHQGNCIRYCLSVNDNVMRSSLSQFDGSHEIGLRFYNNTIINPAEYVIEGVRDGYIADNIFCGGFTASFRSARKNVNDETGEKFINEFTGTMKNNCFWGTCIPTCSEDNIICNPRFTGSDETNPDSYRLAEGSRLIGKGITTDCTGETDIYGNEITASTNVGCYAGQGESNAQAQNPFSVLWKFISTLLGRAYQFIVDCNNKYWLF